MSGIPITENEMKNAKAAMAAIYQAKEDFIIRRANLEKHKISCFVIEVLVRCHSISIYNLQKIVSEKAIETVGDLYTAGVSLKRLREVIDFTNEKFASVNNHAAGESILLAHIYSVTVEVDDEYHHRIVLVCN